MKILAFDIGGSKIAYALTDSSGNLLSAVNKTPTPSTAAEISALIRITAQQHKADGLAIATAGIVFDNHLCNKPNNLPTGYENIDFTELTGLPYLLVNDANAAVWAEYKHGALRGHRHCALLTLGTDVGCGLILNDALYSGINGAAGEVRFNASGTTLANLAKQNGLTETDCFIIYNLAKQGNIAAQRTCATWSENLVSALIQINRILDLEAVALSGSLAKIVDYMQINTQIQQNFFHSSIRIMAAEAENNAGLIGAALLFAEKK